VNRRSLAQVRSGSAAAYKANLTRFQAALDAKIVGLAAQLAPTKARRSSPITATSLFRRALRRRRHRHARAEAGIAPSPAHIAQVIGEMKAAKAKVILVQPFQNRKTAETVARQTDATVLDAPQQPGAVARHRHLSRPDRHLVGSMPRRSRRRHERHRLSVVWAVMKWPLAACLVLPPLLSTWAPRGEARGDLRRPRARAGGDARHASPCYRLRLPRPIAFWISLGVTSSAARLFSGRAQRGRAVPQKRSSASRSWSPAAGDPVLERVAGGKEELEHLLTGDILNVTGAEVGQRALSSP
jgi:hypothetical protein